MLEVKFRVGSHNYGLNDKDSDTDWKVFRYPTYHQLYKGTGVKPKSHMGIGIDNDIEVKDIRELLVQLRKSNPTWIETLYSNKYEVLNGKSKTLSNLHAFKSEIALHNPKRLFDTCFGMYIQKRKGLLKGTSGTQHLIERDGYDSKAGLHAFRALDLLRRLYRFNKHHEENYERFPLIDVYERALRYRFYVKNTPIIDMDTNIGSSTYECMNRGIYKIPSDIIKISIDHTQFIEDHKDWEGYIELIDKDYEFMMGIRAGNYPYEEFLGLLDEMEAQVLKLRDSEFYTQEANTHYIDYVDQILEKEILENIIKSNIILNIENDFDPKIDSDFLIYKESEHSRVSEFFEDTIITYKESSVIRIKDTKELE